MQILDILILAALAGWGVLAAIYIKKQRKRGGGCCGNCNNCAGCTTCHMQNDTEKQK